MNKQELIERIKGLKNLFGNKAEYIEIDAAIKLIEQLNEPQKTVVPQFVADWIEVCKEHLPISLYTAMDPNFMKQNNQSADLMLWIKKSSNQEIFAQAWIFGCEVEEEKRYRVKIIGITNYNSYLNYHKGENKWTIESRMETDEIRTEHTRKELEGAGFGWIFSCEGIEIEEVKE